MVNAMPGMGAPQMSPAEPSPDQLAAFEQLREQVSPTEINREMLATAEQADPVAVAEFRQELAELEVAPEVIDMLNTMVDEVLAAPGEYPVIRQKYLDMGVDEELLPEAFDAGLFAALNVALDELRGPENTAPPQGFARGGIASLKPMAREMAAAGRYGDTMLAHISPVEAQILRRYGGSGTINPQTGAPEFFLKNMFKKLGKAVKKFANTTIGKIVIGTALFMVAGPAAASMLGATAGGAAAAGISGFVSGAGTSLIAGGNLKDSLKAGAISGITAGAAKGAMSRLSAPAPVANKPLLDMGAAPPTQPSATTFGAARAAPITRAPIGAPIADQGIGSLPMSVQAPVAQAPAPVYRPTGTPMMGSGFDPSQAAAPAQAPGALTAGSGAASGPFTDAQKLGSMFDVPQARFGPAPEPRGFFANVKGALTPGDDIKFGQGLKDAYFPSKEQGVLSAEKAYSDTLARTQSEALAQRAYDAALPGMIRQFAPLAATGLGIMALGGGFEEEQIQPPEGFEDFMSGTPVQKDADRIRYGGVNTEATMPQYNPYSYTPPRTAAKGGSMDKAFPRKTGPINGPGTGTSDDIPAMLSDGEFVFTAKAVRGMGNGSRRAGAKKMYALMRKLEARKNV